MKYQVAKTFLCILAFLAALVVGTLLALKWLGLDGGQGALGPLDAAIGVFVLLASLAILLLCRAGDRPTRQVSASLAETQNALRDSESRHLAMLAAIPDLIFRVRSDGVFLDFRAAQNELYVQAPNQIIGQRYQDLMPPEFSAAFEEKFRQALETRSLVTFEYQLPMPGGVGLQDYEARIIPGQSDEVTAVVRNITPQKQAERFSDLQLSLSRTLSSCHNLEEGLRQCLRAAIQTSKLDAGGFYLFNSTTGNLELIVHEGLSAAFIAKTSLLAADSEQVRLAQQGHPLYTHYNSLSMAAERDRQHEGLQFLAMIPIQHQGSVIGCLNISSHSAQDLDPTLRKHLEILADSACTAIARLQAEQAILAREERYRGVFDESVAAIFMFDTRKRFIDSNQAGLDLLGYTREELLTLSMSDVDTNPVDVLPAHAELLAGGRLINYEHQLRRKDGRIITVLNNSRALTRADGAITGMLSTLLDITARKQAEETLDESRQRLQLALDAARMGVWEYDFAAQKLYWSPEIIKFFGVPDHEPSRELLISLCHPDDRGITQAAMDRAIAEHRDYHAEYRVINQGRTYWVEDHGTILRDAHDRPVKVIGTAQDLTERKEAEAERKRLSTAIEQAAEMVVITDVEGVINYANPAFETMTGYSRQEALGRNPRLLKSGKHEPPFYKELWDTLTQGQTWRGQFINRRKDGTLFTSDAVISPIRSASGAITSYVAAQRDVTREQLLERQVRQAQKMEAVGQLASGVAHDFNNLLQAILGFADLLLADLPPHDRKRDDVQEIVRSGQRAATLTKQLLAFSRQDANKPVVVDLNAMVEEAQKMLRRLLGENIRITLELANTLPAIMADRGQIDQIIINLCINARDAMPEGGRLTISTSAVLFDDVTTTNIPEAHPGRYACLAVSDSGTGMSPDTQARLFEPFFSTKGPGKGTGLGLAVIYGIVKQHAGWINVYSKEGQGSTFKIYLPVIAGAAGALEREHEAVECGAGERILLIEDEPVLRTMATRILAEHGYRVQAAGSSTEGIDLFTQAGGDFDLLLSDVVLPDQNGIVTADYLQQRKPELAVVLCSGYTDERSRWRAIEERKYIFLQKPYPLDDLLRTIRTALGNRRTIAD